MWHTPHLSAQLPLPWRDWLLDKGSLTQRLRDLSPEFSVRVLQQTWRAAFYDEQQFLNFPAPPTRIREVHLCCEQTPVVFARTVMPRRSLYGARGQALQHLGAQPLGEILFAQPRRPRAQLQVTALCAAHPLYRLASRHSNPENLPTQLWARRSLFHLAGEPLLVTEVFLPSLLEYATLT